MLPCTVGCVAPDVGEPAAAERRVLQSPTAADRRDMEVALVESRSCTVLRKNAGVAEVKQGCSDKASGGVMLPGVVCGGTPCVADLRCSGPGP